MPEWLFLLNTLCYASNLNNTNLNNKNKRMYTCKDESGFNSIAQKICTILLKDPVIQKLKPSFSFFKKTGIEAIKANIYQAIEETVTTLKKDQPLILANPTKYLSQLRIHVIDLKINILCMLSTVSISEINSTSEINFIYTHIRDLLEGIIDYLEKIPPKEHHTALLISNITNALTRIFKAHDSETSLKDCTRISLSINNSFFTQAMQNRFGKIYLKDSSPNKIAALTDLKNFYLHHGFNNPVIAEYLMLRMNQNDFLFFIMLYLRQFNSSQENYRAQVKNKYFSIHGNNYTQKLTSKFDVNIFNDNDNDSIPDTDKICFILTITFGLTWNNLRTPTLESFTHSFQTTAEGKQIRIQANESQIPLEQFLDLQFCLNYSFSKALLDNINQQLTRSFCQLNNLDYRSPVQQQLLPPADIADSGFGCY